MLRLTKMNTFALTLLITGAIDSIRNLPASALFGSTLIFFFIFSAVVFLIPTALVSAELASNTDNNESGIYQWVRTAFGEHVGFLAIWLQWINNIIWFPTILSFIAGAAAYLIDPALAQNKYYLIASVLISFWMLTLVNIKGIRFSSKFTSFCAITGLAIPMLAIIILFIAWVVLGHPLQIQLTGDSLLPSFKQTDNWFALTAIMLGFAGMELATVHIKDVHQPKKTFPKALAISCVFILVTMTLGSLAIASVLPYNQINLVNGTVETFTYFLSVYHLNWLSPILTVLIIVGSLGGTISWVISPVKGLSQAAEQGFLPDFFCKKNKYGVSHHLLLTQAVLVSLVCLAFVLFPSVNGSYWFLTALCTQLYMLMYVLMFLAALRLRKHHTPSPQAFIIPGKKIGLWSVCLLGLGGCFATLWVGFIPPKTFNIGGEAYYQLLFCSGMAAMIVPILFFYWYRQRTIKLSSPAALAIDNNS